MMDLLPRFEELPLSAIAATPPIRVLLVDDAADIRVLLKLVLEFDDEFVVVAEAGNGEEAVGSARSTSPTSSSSTSPCR